MRFVALIEFKKYILHYCFPFSFLCITVVSTDWIDYCQYERPATDTAI